MKPAKGIKWEHYRELWKNRHIRGYLPETMKLSKAAFVSMLSRHKTVYAKPNQGAFGIGVMQISRLGPENQPSYRVRFGTRQKTFRTVEETYDFVLSRRVKSDYVVQQGIELLTWNHRPFDLRLMMTKQSRSPWQNEGFVGRAAHPRKIVTNIRSGGTAISIEDLLAPYADSAGKQKIIARLNALGRRICEQLEGGYPGIRLFGIDMGLDRRLKPWVIEVNTRPEKICWKCMRKLYRKNRRSGERVSISR
ncbi:YheC/YheD family protein [Paenibacillus hamazuiensis]|uniref:YheC/YheD family protein n=1 Tax=Paenibacillus hamazuiensis TaxID=2936508 RepID=UPI00200CC7F9|nr:YheC/YheD family protein [Paenibacillus hamazuiensis]